MNKKQLSKYMSELAKKRKNPYTPFKDKDYAKAMSQKAAEKRSAQKRADSIQQKG